MEDPLLTIQELSKYLQVSPKTVYRLVQNKRIPCYKVANQWRFKWSVIQEWMEKENFHPPRKSGKKEEKAASGPLKGLRGNQE